MAVPNTFATDTTPIPLADLDANFSYYDTAYSIVSTAVTFNGVVSFPDGTASLPSITNTGDTNTGIFFPAADTIAFAEGGTEAMRITSNGGISFGATGTAYGTAGQVLTSAGNAPPTWTTPATGTVTSVTGTAPISSTGGATPAISLAASYGDTQNPYASKTANYVLAAPNGSAGVPTFRAIVAADIPTLNQNTTGNAGTVTNGAYVNVANTFSANQIISVTDNTNAALRVTQLGTGNALVVEDSTNPDSTPFVVDASGNVGVGTSSPQSRLHVYTGASGVTPNSESKLTVENSATAAISILAPAANESIIYFGSPTSAIDGGLIYSHSARAMIFRTAGNTERMRIDTNGNLAIGTTSTTIAGDSGKIMVDAGSGLGLLANRTGDGNIVRWYRTNSQVGSINLTAGATAYVTSSDYRLKQDIAPMTGALAKVALLKPVTYKWKENGSDGEGFIAHELAEVVPQCVSGDKDAVKEDGSIDPQGIDTSFLVATLTAAIQEQQALITSLTTRITTLENT